MIPPRGQLIALCVLGLLYAGSHTMWRWFWLAHPQAKIDTVAPLMLLSACVIALGIALTWRSANLDHGGGGSFLLKTSCMAIALAASVMIVNQWAHAAAAPVAKSSGPTVLLVHSNSAYLSGPIDFTSFVALENTLKAHPDLDTLVLDSLGGRIPAARGLVRLVQEAGLNTHVEGLCASACALAFLAGQKRTLGQAGQLGFHGYRLISTVATLDISEEESRDAAFFARSGVSGTFTQRAFATPHSEMWIPSQQTLKHAGVLRP